MTQEEKAKRYDEAVINGSRLWECGKITRENYEYMFPELKESEDERIRKALRERIIRYDPNNEILIKEEGISQKQFLAWLEKQGEPTDINPSEFDLRLNKLLKQFEKLPKEELESSLTFYLNVVQNNGAYKEKQGEQKTTIIIPKFRVGDKIRRKTPYRHDKDMQVARVESDYYLCNHLGKFSSEPISFSEESNYELVEQKPADKAEPKLFHEGEWVVSPNGVYWHIDKISNSRYEVTSNTGESSNWQLDTNIYHRFTIQDAKDGDVLAESSCIFIIEKLDDNFHTARIYCALFDDGDFDGGSILHFDKDSTKPATKEQCDLLFQKMKEAGYEWDAEKKELKKIEQKTAWSEEDAHLLDNCISLIEDIDCTEEEQNWLKGIKDRVQPQQEWSEEDEHVLNTITNSLDRGRVERVWHTTIEEVANWLYNKLKSIRPQSQWKPSDEQIGVIEAVINNRSFQRRHLDSLYEQLKKLREG